MPINHFDIIDSKIDSQNTTRVCSSNLERLQHVSIIQVLLTLQMYPQNPIRGRSRVMYGTF